MAFSHPGFYLLLAEKESLPVSMLAMVPARLAKEENTFYRCHYLYGIGTLPAFRRQGLSGTLMHCAKSLASSLNCDFLFLFPASESLVSFYEKQGFETKIPEKEAYPPELFSAPSSHSPVSLAESSGSSGLIPISAEEYLALRANLENTPGVFSLLEPFHTYALNMIEEHLYFYKDIPADTPSLTAASLHTTNPETGFCFYGSKTRPPLKYLEQTEPFSPSGGLLHQIFPLHSLPVPDYTYFQFPMDELKP